MIYIILFVMLLVLDQFTKYIVEQSFYLSESIPIIDEVFNFTYVENRGIAFGLFQGRLSIISILTVVAIVAIFIYVLRNKKTLSILEHFGYTLILSGAVGNMIDRLFRGFVVDMLDFRGIWSFVFNLADVWINVGVFLLIVDYLILRRNEK
ncbi:signal peptidase II [Fusobacterium gonidiaformans 3-1-5R]|uniref:Lipoprotein signal peptidase n=2 Tax=Fusobacterium TaxID=848 RepID=E5BGN4_9FUSO|nr:MULTISPECIES: signal peptidase II [Fusobacterium]AVQ16755.1 signal peptidase II [Fusobacterium gonidiaformans ATCC 25563]EFS21657.1 signal peptidase II [Fusobacterium gonidiaformans 3-1-5R]EFS28330.1 signal peptidase II [Fusobacterium gonidiaformans ATCC 25563]